MNPDGSVTFSFCLDCSVDPGAWASCSIATAHDIERFDADMGGSGAIGIEYDVGPIGAQDLPGQMLFWYGTFPWRKYLSLYELDGGGNAVIPVGLNQSRHFNSDQSCYAADALPPECQYQCGVIDEPMGQMGNCEHDFTSSLLSLTAEQCSGGGIFQGTITARAVRYYQDSCDCIDDSDCEGMTPTCQFAGLWNEECFDAMGNTNNEYCGGLCTDQ